MFEQYHLVLRLDVVLDDVMGGTLLAPVSHDDGRAANDLAGLALSVQLAETGPLTQLLVGVDLDDGDLKCNEIQKTSNYNFVLWRILEFMTVT